MMGDGGRRIGAGFSLDFYNLRYNNLIVYLTSISPSRYA
jgi:hypothetical protein